MFTGIIEEVGIVRELRYTPGGASVVLAAPGITPHIKVGDSISVDGVCLTATRVEYDSFWCDISEETMRVTSFKELQRGKAVNLERALILGGRLGGHLVQGHVDGVGKLIAKETRGQGYEMAFDFPPFLERYLIYKGSVAVNGISLTIAMLEKNFFSVAIIPHTYQSTNLRFLKIGDPVNLEADLIGKYLERFFQFGLKPKDGSGARLSEEYLREQGF